MYYIVTKGGVIAVELTAATASEVASVLSQISRQIADDASRIAGAWENSKSVADFARAVNFSDGVAVVGAVAFGVGATAALPVFFGISSGVAGMGAAELLAGYFAGLLYEAAIKDAGKFGEYLKKISGSKPPNRENDRSSGDPFTGMPWPGGDPGDWDEAEHTVSPLVLDLDGDGVETTTLSKTTYSGTHFNLDARGLSENTGWAGGENKAANKPMWKAAA